MKTEIVLTSATYLPCTNSTVIVYAEETPGGSRDAWKEHTIYHDHDATESDRNEEIDAFIQTENAKLQGA